MKRVADNDNDDRRQTTLPILRDDSLSLRYSSSNDFHLPVLKIPARQHSPFGLDLAELAVLPSWYFENGEMKIIFFFCFVMYEP